MAGLVAEGAEGQTWSAEGDAALFGTVVARPLEPPPVPETDSNDEQEKETPAASSRRLRRPRRRRTPACPLRVSPLRRVAPASETHARVRAMLDLLDGTRADLLRYVDEDEGVMPVLRRCAHSMVGKLLE